MRAMIVDDSRAQRMLLKRAVAPLGFEVIEAENGEDALSKLDTDDPVDVMLVDWNMPVMDGLTFIKRCRSNPEYRDVVLMMVTTESEQSQIVRALAAGAHEYVIKPFTSEVIAEKLALLGLVPA